MMRMFDGFGDWWRKPLNSEGDVLDWFLFVGLVLVAIWLWTRVLKEGGHIIGA